ncbi:hypothetical protein FT663_03683 [Candidozyma haemuli var. vulneris]|uniref:PH domain-containing protein n=1 Tax=Candidozyma haemuli TaxID=45357 RepID=A0A2V1AVP6_9ASCO|nr:hypothetical protein CXQ85_004467 [[Candida] haemuloni]KAF3987772.1 hypothetical protein FT662_03790 [[Candida] haemuloni var. vulneris]KAF3989261.1 hypothetical protein FT663_03683 [[Candida] haemuloni var. vulneris]PVH20951.1 hypothetical protein CXQ85_004467 [[Candida] haemuloni]
MPSSTEEAPSQQASDPVSSVQVNTEASATIKEAAQAEEDELPASAEFHHIKLISVALKEAALDSPSFRASVNHLHTQLMTTEKWILALRSSLTKIPKQVKELQSYVNSFLEYLMPQSLSDGLVDQEYTQQAMNTIFEGLKMVWDISLGLLNYSIPRLESTKDTIMERIALYQTYKVRFDEAQANYDKFLRIHMSTPKSKDPALVMEDSLQLFAVRKEYMSASLDLIIELNEVIEYVNHKIVRFVYLMWHQKVERFGTHPIVQQLLTDVWTHLKRISSWFDNYRGSVARLRKDMKAAKKQIHESTSASFVPSGDLNDYRTSLINSKMLASFPETAVEKHGHLFMKTYIEKSTKPVWVQRWAFLQGGVFGLLVLSPSGTAVQETDKIGALLCNTKYTANEDRRFCFELKTIDTTIVFQAETVQELYSWLKVFENVRTRITTTGDPMTNLFGIASNRYPPLISEFANSNNTSTDKSLTNSKVINKEGQIITSSRLSAHLMKNQKLFQNFVYNQVTRIRLPFFTEYSRSTLIAYSLAGSTAVPTALSANIWGSLNWGCYYLHEDFHASAHEEVAPVPEEPFTKQIGHGIMVPANYPDTLLGSEIQMRALFESEVDNTECCLLSFHCLWSPNSNQELRGTAFITQKNLYFYLHASGFVALSKTPIDQIVEANCVPKKNYDYMKIHKVSGSIKTKIFLGEGLLIAQKINGIIQNITSNNPLDVSGMISKLKDIEREYASKKEELRRLADHTASPNEASSFEVDRRPHDSEPRFRVDFSDDMHFLSSHKIKLPPKAIFHALFGHKSHLMDASYPIVSVKYITHGQWMKMPGNDRGLFRDFLSAIVYHDGKTDTITVRQEIEDMSENEYYCCKTSRSSFKFGMVTFEINTRMVIIATEGGNSKIMNYASLIFDRKTIFNPLLRSLSKTFQTAFANGVHRRLDKTAKVIGTHGQIAKAIYMYGKVPITDVPYVIPASPPTQLNVDTVFRLTLRGTLGSIIRKITSFVYLVVHGIQMFLNSLSMNRVLVFTIICLSFMNVFLMGRSTVTYWQAKNARGVMLDIIQGEPMIMERAIYLNEVKDLIKNQHVTKDNSTCFRIFSDQSFIQNYDQASAWKLKYEDDIARSVATNLRRTLREIGIRRNELIVSLQMLNQLEEEVAKGEWRNWLSDELEKCSLLMNPTSEGETSNEIKASYTEGVDNLLAFCECCSQEMAHLRAFEGQDQSAANI